MSSSSTKNVHFRGEKEEMSLRKITSQSSKAKYNAPLEGRKSLENVPSTHQTNNLRNSLSSSKVPIRLESRTGGCSKSNSEVMINENSKGNSKRKIIDHLNSRKSHPHGEDKVNAHLSEKKPSKLKGNSAFQINITENISYPRHSRSSSSKEGNEHKEGLGQGRIEPKKIWPCKSNLKKFSQSDLHLNDPEIYAAKRKNNFGIRKITNQSQKQSNFKKLSFKTYSTSDLTKDLKISKELFMLGKNKGGELVTHGYSDQKIQSKDNLIENKSLNIISDNSKKENADIESTHNASLNMSQDLNPELKRNAFEENVRNLNNLEDNKYGNEESKFDVSTTKTILDASECTNKLISEYSPNIEEISISKTYLLQTENKYQSKIPCRRKILKKEINEKFKLLIDQYKKSINCNKRSNSLTDNINKNYQKMNECGDHNIHENQMNTLTAFKSSNNNVNGSNTNLYKLEIEDIFNAKKFTRKILLEKEVNEKVKCLKDMFKVNQSEKALSDIDMNHKKNLKLSDIKSNEQKNNFQTNFESASINLTSTGETRPKTFPRIRRQLNYKSPLLNGQSNEGTIEKMENDIFSDFSKKNETGNVNQNESKTVFDVNDDLDISPYSSPGLKDLNKSPRCSQIPRLLKLESGTCSGDFQNLTFHKRKKMASPNNNVLSASNIEQFCNVKEHGPYVERRWNGKKPNETYSNVEGFDILTKDETNIEHCIHSKNKIFNNIAFDGIQREKKNKNEDIKTNNIFSPKSGENSMDCCSENDIHKLQLEESYYDTGVSIINAVYSFTHFKIIFLGINFLFCVLLLKLLFFA